jgi:GTP-binding protein
MYIKSSKYIISSPTLAQCPPETFSEFAFIGRSNVGKSSLINYITNNGSLAKVSKTPGKTKLINHFLINNEWYLVDLPGYGYAKVSKDKRQEWGQFIEDFILHRKALKQLFVLVDSRISPQTLDLDFISWLEDNKIPFTIIYTKIDKLNQKELNLFNNTFRNEVKKYTKKELNILQASSNKKIGADKILNFIKELNDIH